MAKAEVEEAELRTRLQATVDRLRSDHDLAPDVAVSAPCPELPDGIDPGRRVDMLESELDIMGPVNPLALEEYQALQERHSFLQGQLDDIRSTRRELSKVIASIDEEIVTVFASAFADVSVNFTQLFENTLPRWSGLDLAHHAGRLAQHRHRDLGQAVGQERQEALAVVRW